MVPELGPASQSSNRTARQATKRSPGPWQHAKDEASSQEGRLRSHSSRGACRIISAEHPEEPWQTKGKKGRQKARNHLGLGSLLGRQARIENPSHHLAVWFHNRPTGLYRHSIGLGLDPDSQHVVQSNIIRQRPSSSEGSPPAHPPDTFQRLSCATPG